jgi:hypothetical protein
MSDDEKVRTTIYIPRRCYDYLRSHNINLSAWVENALDEQYLSFQAKYDLLEVKKREVVALQEALDHIAENRRMVIYNLSWDQKALLLRLQRKIDKGYLIEHALAEYNANSSVQLTVDEFKKVKNYVILAKQP